MTEPLLSIRNCSIRSCGELLMPAFSWDLLPGQAWLVTGPNGGGKSLFARALAGEVALVPEEGGSFASRLTGGTALVSFEGAATLIEEEHRRDDSDFVEGGVDPGRSALAWIMEGLPAEGAARFPGGSGMEKAPEAQLLGISPFLDRGLKYLSTGELRRVILCRALLSQPALLILDEPFEGLDAASRAALRSFLGGIASRPGAPALVILMDRTNGLPEGLTHALELTDLRPSFSGPLGEFRGMLDARSVEEEARAQAEAAGVTAAFRQAKEDGDRSLKDSMRTEAEILVEMRDVTVAWDGRKVLDGLSWMLRRGEHWLIRGPNGSGKSTFLGLITGDNPQAYSNEVSIFGRRRGTGESVWELKEKMGMVSARLHQEYRSLDGLSLEEVLLSGIHDSIGLYQACGPVERALAREWLELAGFGGRDLESFGQLSYGEQRAILVARAAIKCPPLLVMDEPCQGLDREHRARVLTLLQLIAESGSSTLLHVTHDPAEALPCERRVLELRPGQTPMWAVVER